MRVEIVEQMAPRDEPPPMPMEDASVKLALRNFSNAVRSDDSLFAEVPGAVPGPAAGAGGRGCMGEFVLHFREEKLAKNRDRHFQLLQKLKELLKASGSQDVLTTSLCVAPRDDTKAGTAGFALKIRLEASGDAREVAALRWALGLAQIQQALLFTSRHLRQQLLQNES